MRKIGLQVFKINPDGTTTELTTDGPVKDILETTESYVIVSDDIRKVFLWKGVESSVRSKFIGAKRSQEIRGQVGMHYSVVPLDEGDEDDDFLEIIGGKTEAGIAKEIVEDDPSKGMQIVNKAQQPGFGQPTPMGQNVSQGGPLYTGKESMTMVQEQPQTNFDEIMAKLEEIAIPEGYERELIIIGSHAYSVVEKVQTFLGKKQVEKVMEQVGSIPEGVFFAEEYSPRVLSENGKILAIEFLKKMAGGAIPAKAGDKKQILKDQLKEQLG